MRKEPGPQREWWNILSTTTPESARWKGSLDHDHFATKDTIQLNHGIRNVVGWWGQESQDKPIPKGPYDALNVMHPRALLMLAKYGVEFWPFPWKELPFQEPKRHVCHFNSALYQYGHNRVMKESGRASWLSYVEGVAMGGYSMPVLHAWNALGTNTAMAIDWTWYATTGWMFYLGIPLTQSQFERLRDLAYPSGSFHLILKKEVFPAIEEPLLKILKKRKLPKGPRGC